MAKKRITLKDLEVRYVAFCAEMHGAKDTLRGHHNEAGRIWMRAHE